MPTRITQPMAPVDAIRETPLGVALPMMAPPPNLRKRLTAMAQRAYPGWTYRVTVRTWTSDVIEVDIDARRDPASGAPLAPAPGSAAAEKLVLRTEKVLAKVLEATDPGFEWTVSVNYVRVDDNNFTLSARAARGGPRSDPPTCADGGAVLYPGPLGLSTSSSLPISNNSRESKWVYIRAHDWTGEPPYPSLENAKAPSLSGFSQIATCSAGPAAQNSPPAPPALQFQGTPVYLYDGRTLAAKLNAGISVSIAVSTISDCWVWWWP